MLHGNGPGSRWGSVVLNIPSDPSLIGQTLYGQRFVLDNSNGGRLVASKAFSATCL